MTNELGTTLSDIEAKAERKREALGRLFWLKEECRFQPRYEDKVNEFFNTVFKYIEEN